MELWDCDGSSLHFNIGKRFPVVVFNFILPPRPSSRSVAEGGWGKVVIVCCVIADEAMEGDDYV